MTIEKITERMDYQLLSGSIRQEITALVYDSRKIVPGCMFVCIKGAAFDGHTCIDEAAKKQAAAIVVEQDIKNPQGPAVLKVSDTRLAILCTFHSVAYPFGHHIFHCPGFCCFMPLPCFYVPYVP